MISIIFNFTLLCAKWSIKLKIVQNAREWKWRRHKGRMSKKEKTENLFSIAWNFHIDASLFDVYLHKIPSFVIVQLKWVQNKMIKIVKWVLGSRVRAMTAWGVRSVVQKTILNTKLCFNAHHWIFSIKNLQLWIIRFFNRLHDNLIASFYTQHCQLK